MEHTSFILSPSIKIFINCTYLILKTGLNFALNFQIQRKKYSTWTHDVIKKSKCHFNSYQTNTSYFSFSFYFYFWGNKCKSGEPLRKSFKLSCFDGGFTFILLLLGLNDAQLILYFSLCHWETKCIRWTISAVLWGKETIWNWHFHPQHISDWCYFEP